MEALILAGVFGSRLSKETEKIPKLMMEVREKPKLWYIMKICCGHGASDFIVYCRYKS
jgi:glucose-1-phosphate cytidylyltransferase